MQSGTTIWCPRKQVRQTAGRTRAGLPLCRLYHGRGPRRQPLPPINCQIFPTLFWRLSFSVGLNVTTTKKIVNFLFWGRKAPQRKWENPGYAYEKRAGALRWYPPPEWLIRTWEGLGTPHIGVTRCSNKEPNMRVC